MRKFLLLMVSLGLVLGSATAVVGGPEPGDDEVAITGVGGSSSSATTSVGPNGTEYHVELNDLNSSCMSGNMSTGVELGDFQETDEGLSVDFSGTVSTATPCTTLETDVSEKSENVYSMELVERSGNGTCIECVGTHEIEGSFTADGEYRLEVTKDGEELASKETPNYGETEEKDEGGFSLGFFIGFLQSLFS